MRRFLAALTAFLDAWQPPKPVVVTKPHLSTEQWQEAIKIATSQAYQTGHMQGELFGRQALAAEIEAQFYVDGTREFGPEEARTVALKQLH